MYIVVSKKKYKKITLFKNKRTIRGENNVKHIVVKEISVI